MKYYFFINHEYFPNICGTIQNIFLNKKEPQQNKNDKMRHEIFVFTYHEYYVYL